MKKIHYIAALLLAGSFCALTAQEEKTMEYRRSSIYSVLVNHTDQKFGKEIGEVFLKMPVPDKYNDHDLSVKVVSTQQKMKDRHWVDRFIDQNGIASRMVAKWFCRDFQTGECSTRLIKERGLYNASEFDKELANRSVRGKAMLEDAGEELIGNTFILVNDILYIDKAKRSQNVGMGLKLLGAVATAATGESAFSDLGDSMSDIAETLKGFRVNINTHLYRLVWDEETAMTFYTEYYSDKPDAEKKAAFEKNRDKFKLEYVGSQHSKGSNTSFLGVNLDEPEQMIRKACQRALDENVAALQKNYESFKVKTPLVNTAPIWAEIGLKEGITADSKFEVLEAIQDENGHITYKRAGVIKPVENLIWDNRYMAAEEGAYGADFNHTTFKKVSGGDFYAGMLIREIK